MGCYPLFSCFKWNALHIDLEILKNEYITLSAVTDPFGDYNRDYLNKCFKDIVRPFKEHFIISLNEFNTKNVSNNHKRNSRKALKIIEVEKIESPIEFINEWIKLYDNLIKKHNITGIPTFSRISFMKQMMVPGIIGFRALHKHNTVGMTLWIIQNDIAYYHLGAYNDLGYQLRASFAIFWEAIEYFQKTDVQWLNLGAGAGVKSNGKDGLTRFKRGWATGTRMSYFCGRIFDKEKYIEISKSKNTLNTDYFPAYRKGEFS
jgi:hypothetical protein